MPPSRSRRASSMRCPNVSIPYDRVLLGGFSQGAVMAYALALAGRPRPAGVLAMSGFIPAVEGFELALDGLNGYPVTVTHGALDPIIGVEFSRRDLERLERAGADVRYYEEPIGHQIHPAWLSELGTGSARQCPRRDGSSDLGHGHDARAATGRAPPGVRRVRLGPQDRRPAPRAPPLAPHARAARPCARQPRQPRAVPRPARPRGSDRPPDMWRYSMPLFPSRWPRSWITRGRRARWSGASLGANVALETAVSDASRLRGLVIEMPVLDNALLACALAFTPCSSGSRSASLWPGCWHGRRRFLPVE